MDTTSSLWLDTPSAAFRIWQETEAVGADRKPFSERSRVQHAAMFDRFLRHLLPSAVTVASFGPEHVEAFLDDVESRAAPGTTTRLRYAKMLDRLCRHLIEVGVRSGNPATELSGFERWPDDEPLPVHLDAAADLRLQKWVDCDFTGGSREVRNRAIVALFLATGLSASELRQAQRQHLLIDTVRPHIYVPKRGARESRKFTLPAFAWAAFGMDRTAGTGARWITLISLTEGIDINQRCIAWGCGVRGS
jgi:integrase